MTKGETGIKALKSLFRPHGRGSGIKQLLKAGEAPALCSLAPTRRQQSGLNEATAAGFSAEGRTRCFLELQEARKVTILVKARHGKERTLPAVTDVCSCPSESLTCTLGMNAALRVPDGRDRAAGKVVKTEST